MQCPKCGAWVEGMRACPYCGAQCEEAVNPNRELQEEMMPEKPHAENFTLFSAYASMFKKYFQFSGRSRRREFWLAMLANLMIIFLYMYIVLLPSFFKAGYNEDTNDAMHAMLGISVLSVYSLVMITPMLALTVRRLHDIGKSGVYVLFYIVPIALQGSLGMISAYVEAIKPLIPYLEPILRTIAMCFFAFLLLDSQPGANAYGENPKGS